MAGSDWKNLFGIQELPNMPKGYVGVLWGDRVTIIDMRPKEPRFVSAEEGYEILGKFLATMMNKKSADAQ